MTTPPIISASAPMVSRDTSPAPGQAGDGPAFRDVLASQPAGQAPVHVAAPQDHGNGKSQQASDGQATASGKTAPAGKKNDDRKTDAAGSEASAQAASLPDIALYIAGLASAAALAAAATQAPAAGDGIEATPSGTGTTSGPANASPVKPVPPGGQPEAAPPGLTASLALPGAAQAPGADSPHDQTAAPTAAAAGAAQADHKPARQAAGGDGPLPLDPAGTHAVPQNTSRTPPADTSRPSALSASGSATPGPAILAMAQAAVAQPSATMAAPANTAATAPSVPVPFQSPQWGGELGRQFVTLVQSGQPGTSHIAQLRLDPPNLGPLHVAIHVSDNVAQAVFVSPHAQVRQAVENALPQLQQQLAQAGIALGQASVSDQGASHQGFGDGTSSPRRSGTASSSTAAVGATTGQRTATGTRSPAPNALVDTFA